MTQELEPLNAQIGQVREKLDVLEGELRVAEAELETFSADRLRFDALQDVCTALDALEEMGAAELFWEGVPQVADTAGHRERLRERIVRFEGEIRGARERHESLQAQAGRVYEEMECLYEEVRQAYAREERRLDEFVIEREISAVPFRQMIMPWTGEGESERRFRRFLMVALFWSAVVGSLIPLVNLPIPDRSAVVVEIPDRLAMLVKKEPPRPEPIPERPREEKKPEPEPEKPEKPEKPQKSPAKEKQVKVAKEASKPAGTQEARKKAENTGVLAFKSSFADLMDETPVAKLGAEARLNDKNMQAAGQARAQRSLVAMQAKGSSGGIGGAAVSRNIGAGGGGKGGNGIGKVGFARVESAVAGLAEEAGRPLSDGPGPGRTDEEIQIVFDRYKATLYRIYNKELRRDPTLRGKMLLRLIIEPGGEVSLCRVESTDLASAELVAQIVERVERFNFGPKEGVPKTTILYPIDFLPAG
ncbi:AgmX/PglI C-terminal domain-containing protein [Desulfuromonas sp. TF]|uniref:AgmX/PglI C-terminal domain-containing protein n=1 Tax=Desulfuromonas sp. TF TaxID=1232410 RepID=UPI001D03B30F|nr:AgmX/PglI C-terminal domain-containing protein [Desulfuromonas sp. TF]